MHNAQDLTYTVRFLYPTRSRGPVSLVKLPMPPRHQHVVSYKKRRLLLFRAFLLWFVRSWLLTNEIDAWRDYCCDALEEGGGLSIHTVVFARSSVVATRTTSIISSRRLTVSFLAYGTIGVSPRPALQAWGQHLVQEVGSQVQGRRDA